MFKLATDVEPLLRAYRSQFGSSIRFVCNEALRTYLNSKGLNLCNDQRAPEIVKKHRPTYQSWHAMIKRCNNPGHSHYRNYGGRGVKVCNRWLAFENFFADMGERPAGLVLDRINNDWNYEPGNCRWTDVATSLKNKRPRGKDIKKRKSPNGITT